MYVLKKLTIIENDTSSLKKEFSIYFKETRNQNLRSNTIYYEANTGSEIILASCFAIFLAM